MGVLLATALVVGRDHVRHPDVAQIVASGDPQANGGRSLFGSYTITLVELGGVPVAAGGVMVTLPVVGPRVATTASEPPT